MTESTSRAEGGSLSDSTPEMSAQEGERAPTGTRNSVKPTAATATPTTHTEPDAGAHDAHDSFIYNGFAKLYDPVFTRAFYPRVSRTIHTLDIPSDARVLELGVGTGLSLEAYPKHARILGIDYSAAMLREAQRKVSDRGLHHVQLEQMDATALNLPDAQFDFVMAFHVVTVVPEPLKLMREAMRVLRPGGTLMVVNHFRNTSGWLARFEQRIDPLLRKLGWTTMTLGEMLDPQGLTPTRIFRDRPDGLFYAVEIKRP